MGIDNNQNFKPKSTWGSFGGGQPSASSGSPSFSMNGLNSTANPLGNQGGSMGNQGGIQSLIQMLQQRGGTQ